MCIQLGPFKNLHLLGILNGRWFPQALVYFLMDIHDVDFGDLIWFVCVCRTVGWCVRVVAGCVHELGLCGVAGEWVTRRKLLTPCTAEEHTKYREHLQKTQPTVNRHTSQTKHQALSKWQPGRRKTPNNTTAVHALAQQPAIITRTQQGHHQILSCG